ncbi:MAG TPA: SH3 domain-containing protein, partial [Pseudobdellovibrionaceae bacterium]|nr:SH3 domain-containing protein [Pseudobdellovibrionaceae bacterium]
MRKFFSLLIIPTLMGLTGFPQPVQANVRGAADIEAGDPLVVQAPRGLNVRKKPNAQRIGAIPDGQMIFATGPAKKHQTGRAGLQYWLPIRYQNESNEWVNGWIYLRHTARTETDEVAEETGRPADVVPNKEDLVDGPQEALEQKPAAVSEETVDPAQPMRLSVSVNSRARFRASPSLSGRILGRLKNDTDVEVIGRPRGEWIPIRVPATGETGWMHVSLLEAEGKLNPLELADRHQDSGKTVDDLIAAYEKTLPTEGGHVGVCTDCEQGGKGQNLEPIPAGSGKAYIYPVNAPIRSRFGTRKDPITGRQKQ